LREHVFAIFMSFVSRKSDFSKELQFVIAMICMKGDMRNE